MYTDYRYYNLSYCDLGGNRFETTRLVVSCKLERMEGRSVCVRGVGGRTEVSGFYNVGGVMWNY